ncbi:MAG: phosphoribosylaminoimidazolesuccinocarboxamide synthase [Firmicutes bacterium]|nr:phosphoribosylaminoimidazolesuccinocarboxamide synthase [Bacillota bacterium]
MEKVLYEGKSKLVCAALDEQNCIIRYKDTATAFDGKKKEELHGKGALNAAISNFIYRYLEDNGVKTHFIKALDETSVLVKRAEIIMVEVIVRNVAAGSFSRKYGVPEGYWLKNAAVEFSLKSDELGDPMINATQITALGIASKAELEELVQTALKINKLLVELFMKAGIKLIDFKLEFGRSGDGIILCDEISPDSCRLWEDGTDKKLDKDRFRQELGGVTEGYADVLRRLKSVG